MKSKIAVICEGETSEPCLLDNIQKIFFNNKNSEIVILTLPASENIYMLYEELQKHQYMDIVEYIRYKDNELSSKLRGLSRDDFVAIYLFFDYDGQDCRSLEKRIHSIESMLTVFNKRDIGKLYISYPMLEAIRDFDAQKYCHDCCHIKENVKRYKHISSTNGSFQDFKKYDFYTWSILCKHAASKANCLVNSKNNGCGQCKKTSSAYKIPSFNLYHDTISQKNIFDKQKKKYILPNNEIAILSAFPLFILDYFNEKIWDKIMSA